MARRIIAVNEAGYRVGESHPRATIPDSVVDLIRELREDRHFTLGMIAMRLGISKTTIGKICRYEVRAQVASDYRVVVE